MNKWDIDIVAQMRIDDFNRELEKKKRQLNRSMQVGIIEIADRLGWIDNEEMTKYYLDETDTYIPKLNNKAPKV